jgi:hypothetical protein
MSVTNLEAPAAIHNSPPIQYFDLVHVLVQHQRITAKQTTTSNCIAAAK